MRFIARALLSIGFFVVVPDAIAGAGAPRVSVEPGPEPSCSLEQVLPKSLPMPFGGMLRCSGEATAVERAAFVSGHNLQSIDPGISAKPDHPVWVVIVRGEFHCSLAGSVHTTNHRGYYLIHPVSCLGAGSGLL